MTNQNRIDSLIQMLSQEPQDEFLNYALGLEYSNSSENYLKAELQFKKVIANNGSYIAAYFQLGKLYELMNQKELALEQYRFGLDLAKIQKDNKATNELSEAIFMLED